MKFGLLLLAFLAFVVSQNNVPDQRNVQITANQQTLYVQAIYSNGSYQDSFSLDMTLSRTGMQLVSGHFQYQNQNSENQTNIQFDFVTHAVLEINTTEHAYYDGDHDSIIKYYPDQNEQIDWSNWINETKFVDGIHVYSFRATTTDGVFTTRVHIAVQDVDVNGVAVGPNDVKIDFEVHDFNYTAGTKSRLALYTEVRSQSQSHNSGQQAIDGNNLVFGDHSSTFPFGSFSWAPNANASNKSIEVIAWSPEAEVSNRFDIYFTFNTDDQVRPAHIVWDPRIGLDYNAVPGGPFCIGSVCGVGAYFIIIGIIVGVILLVVIILVAYFKKRSGYDSIDNKGAKSYV